MNHNWNSCPPAVASAHFEKIVQEAAEICVAFRKRTPRERNRFRDTFISTISELGLVALEMRQLIRREENYENFCRMNRLEINKSEV